MSDQDGAAGPDLTRPDPARVYDHLLGGAHNFAVDRAFAEQILLALPDARRTAVENRAFVGRAVRACLERGCRQFLDLGSGIPTADPVHELVQRYDPSARIVHVDVEPVAVAVSREVLGGVEGVGVVDADLTDPDAVLGAPEVTRLLDPRLPTAIVAAAAMHFVADDVELDALLDRYGSAFGAGSMIAMSHCSTDVDDPEVAGKLRRAVRVTQAASRPPVDRDRPTLRRLLRRLDLLEPGLVDVTGWRSEPGRDAGGAVGMYGAVGTVIR